MATAAELISLKNRIIAIIQQHGGLQAKVNEAMLKGAVSPNNSITYLSNSEFELCIEKSFLKTYKTPAISNNSNQTFQPNSAGNQN